MTFKPLEQTTLFFDLLPSDWQESINPFWEQVKEAAIVYTLEDQNEILAGGIVFSQMTPEMEAYNDEAKYWFSKKYAYIGYVWVPLEKRNKNYGSLWLKHLLSLNDQQHYWLTTEDQKLRYFYEKTGFNYVKTLRYDGVEEDLFVSQK